MTTDRHRHPAPTVLGRAPAGAGARLRPARSRHHPTAPDARSRAV
ncbi:hypothetical protein [Streptomyces sp. NPDC017673]